MLPLIIRFFRIKKNRRRRPLRQRIGDDDDDDAHCRSSGLTPALLDVFEASLDQIVVARLERPHIVA